jgi:hypothetical protein
MYTDKSVKIGRLEELLLEIYVIIYISAEQIICYLYISLENLE